MEGSLHYFTDLGNNEFSIHSCPSIFKLRKRKNKLYILLISNGTPLEGNKWREIISLDSSQMTIRDEKIYIYYHRRNGPFE
jgi:hypothetical protein